MDIISLNYSALRLKTAEKIKKYLTLSDNNRLTVGLYKEGKLFVFGNVSEENGLFYDIGSVSKTVTAHLILKLHNEGRLDINQTIDDFLPLKKGKYPTVFQLLTHTAGYNYLTPAEFTVPSYVLHGFTRKNPYENCTVKTVLKSLEHRRFLSPRVRYGYSDFSFAVLSVVAEAVTQKPFSVLFNEFIKNDLGLENTTTEADAKRRTPPAVRGKKILPFWVWKKDNPYIGGGGIVSNIEDILHYVALQIESDKPYITAAHAVCKESEMKNNNHLMCIGWHTNKRSNQLWHVGGASTFRTSIILNKKLKLGVVVLGNAQGRLGANCHYIAKILYGELKNKKIHLD